VGENRCKGLHDGEITKNSRNSTIEKHRFLRIGEVKEPRKNEKSYKTV